MSSTRSDWLKWVAAAFALVATASAEYALARAIGMHWLIAAAVPGALDAYVVRALRAHREVLTAVLAMVAVNAASHLVTAGVLVMHWSLITAVSAIAPLVLWRVHALGSPGEWRARKVWGAPGSVSDPEHVPGYEENVGPVTVNEPVTRDRAREHEENAGPVTSEWDRDIDTAVSLAMPDYVPGEWARAGELCQHGWATGLCPPCAEFPDVVNVPARTLKAVPDLPDTYVAAVLTAEDMERMPQARVIDRAHRDEHGRPMAMRVLKVELGVGTDRARRIHDALAAEHSVNARGERP